MSNTLNLSKTSKLTYSAMLIALSAVGALIKINGSIAFDSMPGFFAALFLGPATGAIVAGLGHLLSALTSGFPLTMPMHIIVTFEMFIFAYAFGIVYRKTNGFFACFIGIILNGPIAALVSVPTSIFLGLPLMGWKLFYVIIFPLTVASILNVILAFLVFEILDKRMG
ncbi:MAG: ECF transporter S component [Firmicutes bacterium]|nr:ECF transporter S component [Bacillota bacterium]